MILSGRRALQALVLAGGFLLLLHAPLRAVLMGFTRLTIDFTNPAEAAAKAKWSEDLEASKEGLSLRAAPGRQDDSWVVTEPEGVGLSWRPLQGATLRVVVEGLPVPELKQDDSLTIPDGGRVFVRFGPDFKNWSSWQSLTYEMRPHKEKGALFTGYVGVISTDRASYVRLILEYGRLDVPWGSDEEAMVKWILDKDPQYFERHLPFVGWLQFRYEPPLTGTFQVKKLHISISSSTGGIHAIPKDEAVRLNHRGPWRFKAQK